MAHAMPSLARRLQMKRHPSRRLDISQEIANYATVADTVFTAGATTATGVLTRTESFQP